MKQESFRDYDAAYSRYRSKIGGENIQRELRLFDIRFRLALAMRIDFENISKPVKESYIVLFELVELWNAFEAFLSWQECKWHNIKKELNNEITQKPLVKAVEELRNLYKKKREELKNYFSLLGEVKLNGKLRLRIKSISENLENPADILPMDLLGLISSERNMFYHLGETAKKRMNYSTGRKLLTIYKSALSEYISLLAIQAIEKELAK
jgi:hypothetical protein